MKFLQSVEIPQQITGHTGKLKRGFYYDVKGRQHVKPIRLKYAKMQKGNFCFSDILGNKYQLNKEGYLISY